MTCRDCKAPMQTYCTQELQPEVIRRYHRCDSCGRKTVSLQLEMGQVARVPKDVAVAILEGTDPLVTLKDFIKPS